MYTGHIVVSSNAYDADGNYLCLPDVGNAYPPQTYAPLLNVKDVKDSYGKTIACAGCSASGRSAVLIVPDSAACPTGWYTEYTGYYAANPKWPGENICVDASFGAQLSLASCNNLAVIAKGPFQAYGYSDVVTCLVCSI